MGKFIRRLVEVLLLMSKTMLEVGWSFILWSMLYLEGWSSRSSYFIGVALVVTIINKLRRDNSKVSENLSHFILNFKSPK